MTSPFRHFWLTPLCVAALALTSAAAADDPAPPALDQQLLEDLGNDLGVDLPADGVGQPPQPPQAQLPKPAPSEIDRQLMEDIDGEDLGEPDEQPLEEIAQQMKQVQQRIAERDTSAETQQLQQRISRNLAKLIEQAQNQQGSSGKSSNKPGKSGKTSSQAGPTTGEEPPPASESTQRVDRSEGIERGSADVKDMLRRVWGHLPEKLREQMQNSVGDEFLPKYEKLIEDYYRRLAEQERAGP